MYWCKLAKHYVASNDRHGLKTQKALFNLVIAFLGFLRIYFLREGAFFQNNE